MSLSKAIRILLLIMCATSAGRAAATTPLLSFTDLRKPDLQAEFHTRCGVTGAPLNVHLSPIPTKSTTFRLFIDANNISFDVLGQFFTYPFYVQGPQGWQSCEADVATSGVFLDHYEPVQFTFTHDDGTTEDDWLKLPIHSITKNDFLEITTDTTPLKVNLSKAPPAALHLRNLLPDMPLVVNTIIKTSATTATNWEGLGETRLTGTSIRIAPGDTETVQLPLRPLKLPALLATLGSLKPNSVHDKLELVVSYASDLGGANRTRHVDLGVRFVPSLLSLLLALISGSLLGSLGAQLVPTVTWKGISAFARRVCVALVFSIIAEIFAIVMVGLGSQFVFFNAELDPWQFLPTLFIAFIVSGGKDVLTHLRLANAQQEKTKTDPPTQPEPSAVTP